ncbi:endolytic transglycosylase MltG [bacterium]|nr:endolytic transglycosylase MltG [bacterium]NCT22044.1 endolytic transglycosylase MltG [bacterium]
MPTVRRRAYFPLGCVLPVLLMVLLAIGALLAPALAARTFGAPAANLGALKTTQYAIRLLWYDGLLTEPVDAAAAERLFAIPPGTSAAEVAFRLESQGFIRSADAFSDYLVYAGLDTRLQSGEFTLSPALSPAQIAQKLQDATPERVKYVILPGWRLEEVAASLPTSGLAIFPDEFLALTANPPARPSFLPENASAEGFLLPGEYVLNRDTTGEQFLAEMLNQFDLAVGQEMRLAFDRQGLTVYQAVTLASLVQREAVQAEEQPLIASVFLNRLAIGMKLDSDPTVQYALGFDPQRGWWRVPLTLDDLKVNSPFNTYQNHGLPPAPISSPGLNALQAVAFPAQSDYFYFRARCDGSGLHVFAKTFEEHLANGCP